MSKKISIFGYILCATSSFSKTSTGVHFHPAVHSHPRSRYKEAFFHNFLEKQICNLDDEGVERQIQRYQSDEWERPNYPVSVYSYNNPEDRYAFKK